MRGKKYSWVSWKRHQMDWMNWHTFEVLFLLHLSFEPFVAWSALQAEQNKQTIFELIHVAVPALHSNTELDQQRFLPCVGWMVWKLFRNHSCGRPVNLFYNTAHCTVTKPRNALFFFEWCTSKSQLTQNSFTFKDDDVLTRCYESGKLAHIWFLSLSNYYLPEEIEGSLLAVAARQRFPFLGLRCSRETVGLLTYWHSTTGVGGTRSHWRNVQKKNLEDHPTRKQKREWRSSRTWVSYVLLEFPVSMGGNMNTIWFWNCCYR